LSLALLLLRCLTCARLCRLRWQEGIVKKEAIKIHGF